MGRSLPKHFADHLSQMIGFQTDYSTLAHSQFEQYPLLLRLLLNMTVSKYKELSAGDPHLCSMSRLNVGFCNALM